jgi:enoyl-CoA hydratase
MSQRYRGFDMLKVEWVADGVLKVAFNRPEQRNAMNDAMHRQITGIWPEIDRDEEVRAVLVCGEGSDFCMGGELALVEAMLDDPEQRQKTMEEAKQLVFNIIQCSKPIVSAIQGSAIGGGLAVALLADISVAAFDARLLDGHMKIGLAAGDHAVLIWPLLCGLAKAKYHILMNKPVDGIEAERIGLVSLAVSNDEVYQTALSIAENLAKTPEFAVRWTKYAFNEWLRGAFPQFELSNNYELLSFDTSETADLVNGLRRREVLPR